MNAQAPEELPPPPFPLGRGLCLALILAASALVHIKGIASPMLDYHFQRQCNTAAIARNYRENGLRFFHPQIDWSGNDRGPAATEFPLYTWLIGLLWPMGLGVLWGRVLAAAFSALTAVYLFRFLEEKLGLESAFYSAVLFSFIPLEVYFGRTVQPEALALLSTVAAFYHWERAFAPDRHPDEWLAAVFFAFLAISHKIPYAYLFIPMAYLAWQKLGREAIHDGPALLAFPITALGVYMWYRYTGKDSHFVPSYPREILSHLSYRRLPYFVQFQFISRFPELVATYGGMILIFFGAREIVFRRRLVFFAVWFLSICAYLVAGGDYTFRYEYTSLPLVPVNAAFMGEGLRLLRESAARLRPGLRRWALAGLALLVLSVPIHAALRIKHWYRINYPFLINAEAAADKISSRGDLFITNHAADSLFLFHLHRRGWGYDPEKDGSDPLDFIRRKIPEGAKFFATEKAGPFADKGGLPARGLYSRFPVAYDDGSLLVFRLKQR